MKRLITALVISAQLAACATYENKSVSFKPPQGYGNFRDVSGLQVGGEAFDSSDTAGEVFGFNILKAGVLPVQLVMDNKSSQTVEVVVGQTFLIDDGNRYWKLLSNREAAERVQKATESGAITGGAGKGATWGAAAGAILGLALGIVSGRNVGEAALKGGVLGGAGGAVIGGSEKGGDDRRRAYRIADDVREKGLEGKQLGAEALASGFIFFPAEAKNAKELRLQLKFRESGQVQTITLKFK